MKKTLLYSGGPSLTFKTAKYGVGGGGGVFGQCQNFCNLKAKDGPLARKKYNIQIYKKNENVEH